MFKEYLNQYRTIITENNPNNGICYDGAVDPSQYFSKRNRLMFLLKETNGNNNNGEHNEILFDWDYMEWVRKQANGSEPLYRSVYRNIAMWSKMFNVYANENREPVESEFLDNGSIIIDKSLLNSLRDVAIVNLIKKLGYRANRLVSNEGVFGRCEAQGNIIISNGRTKTDNCIVRRYIRFCFAALGERC